MMKRRHLINKQKRKSVLFCLMSFLFSNERVGENLIFRLKISLSFVLFFFARVDAFFFVVDSYSIIFHFIDQTEESKNVFSLFSVVLS